MSPVYDRKDHYYKKAKEEGKASRAIYKLEEIDRQFHLLKGGERVIDLGCAPGGWLQYLAKRVGSKGKAVGVDLLEVKASLPEFLTILRGDITDPKVQEECLRVLAGPADLVLSDMSPNLSGIRFRDHYESYQLAMTVLKVARKVLKPGGVMVVKIFPGDELKDYKRELEKSFAEIKTLIPQATRKGSTEIYLIARNFKSN